MILKRNIYIFLVTLCQLPIHSAFAYTNRSLISYFTNNILWRVLIYGGYYSLGTIVVGIILAYFFEKFRTVVISFSMAVVALYLLILIYEVVEDLSWMPDRYGN